MTTEKINPDNAMAQQLDGQWLKMMGFVLWKLSPTEPVVITDKDMEAMTAAYEAQGGPPVVLAHGRNDAIILSLVTMQRAQELAAYDQKQTGRA